MAEDNRFVKQIYTKWSLLTDRKRVGNLKDTPHNTKVVRETLFNNPAMVRIAGFVDSECGPSIVGMTLMRSTGIFRTYFPRMYDDYARIIHSLCEQDPSLQHNFSNNVFTAATFNLGPRATTMPHLDHLNIAGGMCAIIALGDFDEDEDAYLVIHDLNLMIRFPRGTVIFLPSALLLHSNTVMKSGRRYSMTMYTAGGLARWVECDGMSQKTYLASGRAPKMTGQERWEHALERFPVYEL